jgi:hypothetical protein
VGTFHVAVDIARTPAEVFALVAEPLDMAQWYDAAEPDRRVTLASRSGPTPFRYRYTLDAIPTGTRLSLDGEISAAGVAGVPRVLDGAAAHLFRRGMQRNLRQLALLLEAS